MTHSDHSTISNPLLGIALKVASVAIFVGMSSCLKAAGQLPAGQLAFFRSFFAVFPILAFLVYRKELRWALKTERPFGHIARGIIGVTSMALGFFALTRLPLPDAITLNYAQPLLIVIFSAIFMGEVIRIYRWSAVVVGLIGVVIISWPKLTLFGSGDGIDHQQAVGVVAALLAAGISAVALLLVRSLVHTERTSTVVLWFSLTASVITLCSAPFGWAPISNWQAFFLISAGFCGGIAQILMTEAYRHAEASTVAPFEYTSMIFAILVGYFAFSDVPTAYTLVGGAIVIGAGVFIVWREQRLGIERNAAKKATPPQ